MEIKADCHIHTSYCDGKDTPRDIVESAYKRGFTHLGFSGHSYFAYPEPFGMSDTRYENYKEDILSLKDEYKGKMQIIFGIEQEYYGNRVEAEYCIGSCHCLKRKEQFITIDSSPELLETAVLQFWDGNWYSFIESYYNTIARLKEKTNCDLIGHFDLVTKFNEGNRYFDENSEQYFEIAWETMKYLKKWDIPFEVNSGAISRGYRKEPYPSMRLLKELNNIGGKVSITSDSHRKETVGYHRLESMKRIYQCGFRKHSIMTEDGMMEIKIG